MPSRACNKILIQTISFNWLIDVDETRLKLTTTRKQSVLLKILPTFKMQNIFLCNLRDYIYEQTSNFDGTVTFCLCKLDDKKYQRWTLYTNKSCQELLSIKQHAQRFVVNQYFQGPDYLISLFFDDFNSAVFCTRQLLYSYINIKHLM